MNVQLIIGKKFGHIFAKNINHGTVNNNYEKTHLTMPPKVMKVILKTTNSGKTREIGCISGCGR